MHTSIIAPDRHCSVARKSYAEAEQKNADMALAPAWERLDFLRLTARPFGNHLACADLETPRMRLGFENYEGDFRFRGALNAATSTPKAGLLAFLVAGAALLNEWIAQGKV